MKLFFITTTLELNIEQIVSIERSDFTIRVRMSNGDEHCINIDQYSAMIVEYDLLRK